MSNGNTIPAYVQMNFFDNFVPSLAAGEYLISLSQTLSAPDISGIPNEPFTASQSFLVQGPRYVVDPADVHRVYPPQNGTGKYHEYLPMVVFNKRALPWERLLDNNAADSVPDPPWMALLVFTEDELPVPNSAPQGKAGPTRTVSMKLNSALAGDSTMLVPPITPEELDDPVKIDVNVIEISKATFQALVPMVADLPFLAHVRQVLTLDHKEPINSKHDGWFSTVFANRFAVPPAPNASEPRKKNIVHLVSLEGFADLLKGLTSTRLQGIETVRLISLMSWTYTCLPDNNENFRSLMLNLIGPPDSHTDLLLRVPPPATAVPLPNTPTLGRLTEGYVPLKYETASGAETFAWYRGPLAPSPVGRFLAASVAGQTDNPQVPLSSTEAMIYDPATGIFDESYAVAFQTGRSLALACLPFATGLLQWRRSAQALVDQLMEYIRSPHLSGLLQKDNLIDANGNLMATGVDDLMALLDVKLIPNMLKEFLANEFAGQIAGQVGNAEGSTGTLPAPSSSPDPLPVVPADLLQLMQEPAVTELIGKLCGLGEDNEAGGDMLPEQLIDWLAEKALLYDVPFNNFVASQRLLPLESIRFFYIDRNWIDFLIDGALSVGIQTRRDSLFHQLFRDDLHVAVDRVLHKVRDRLRNVSPTPVETGTMAGFVLRSAVVSGWPGMEVRAWAIADPVNPMKPLRLDRVSPSVMLAIYPDVPVRVEFNEPSEGLLFGVDDQGAIHPRFVPGVSGFDASKLGQKIDPDGVGMSNFDTYRRNKQDPNSVLGIGIAGGLAGDIFKNQQLALTPATFALQIVQVPEQMLFLPLPRAAK